MEKRLLPLPILVALLALCPFGISQTAGSATSRAAVTGSRSAPPPNLVCDVCIRAHEEFLASDAMQGRGSATHDEWVAAAYIASELQRYGIQPAGDDGGYIQRAAVMGRKVTSVPTVTLTSHNASGDFPTTTWNQGKEFLTVYLSQNEFSGRLQKIVAGSGANASQERLSWSRVRTKLNSNELLSRPYRRARWRN